MAADDLMPTFRQKIQMNNQELLFFNKEIESWQRDSKTCPRDESATLEDVSLALSSDDEDFQDETTKIVKNGKTCLKSGEWSRAVSLFSSAVSSKMSEARHYANRAVGYLKTNRLSEAEADCSRAIDLDPKCTKGYLRRACARKRLGKCKESCDDLEAARRLEPNNKIIEAEIEALVSYRLNQVLNYDGNNDEKLDLALKLKTQGNKLIELGNYENAIEKFALAIKLNPNEPTFYANRAICYMKLKRFLQAENDCSSALSLDPTYVKIYLRRARVRKSMGKFHEAKEDLNSALAQTPSGTHILDEIAELNLKIGDDPTGKTTQKSERVRQPELQSNNKSDNKLTATDEANRSNVVNLKVERTASSKKSKNSILNISQYDVREVFPLNPEHASANISGPLVKVWVEDSKFVLPEKLFEIPERFKELCSAQ